MITTQLNLTFLVIKLANCFSTTEMNSNIIFLPTSHINEDKRKTEGQKQIFDVVYEVDGCPVSLRIAIVCLSVVVCRPSSRIL